MPTAFDIVHSSMGSGSLMLVTGDSAAPPALCQGLYARCRVDHVKGFLSQRLWAAFGQCGCRITSLASMEVWALNSAVMRHYRKWFFKCARSRRMKR